jgi:hypothetical protein
MSERTFKEAMDVQKRDQRIPYVAVRVVAVQSSADHVEGLEVDHLFDCGKNNQANRAATSGNLQKSKLASPASV